MDATGFKRPLHSLVNNWQAREIRSASEAREGLFEQVPNPVYWTDTIRLMASRGVTTFIEVGPGNVLSGLLRNIDSSLTALKFGEAQDLEKLLATLA